MLTSIMFISCDDHIDVIDTSTKIGNILCTDGQIVTINECERQGKQPIAVVFYMNDGTKDIPGRGYAVYLHEVSPMAYADSLGVRQGTSTDVMAYNGNQNTYSLQASTTVKSPLGKSVFSIWHYGQSAFIPSVAEMQLLYAARQTINPYIIRCGGTPLTDFSEDTWLWTSTAVEGQDLAKAWLFSIDTGARMETPKDESHKSRPIITIY